MSDETERGPYTGDLMRERERMRATMSDVPTTSIHGVEIPVLTDEVAGGIGADLSHDLREGLVDRCRWNNRAMAMVLTARNMEKRIADNAAYVLEQPMSEIEQLKAEVAELRRRIEELERLVGTAITGTVR